MSNAKSDEASFKLLPLPQTLTRGQGVFQLEQELRLTLHTFADPLLPIVRAEWQRELGGEIRIDVQQPEDGQHHLSIGSPEAIDVALPDHHEGYVLQISASGIRAHAKTFAGLLYAWQTLKQLLRQFGQSLPAVTITDWPSLDWRIYHLDLKGTRRTLDNLHDILPRLAELKINALLVEYEDYIQLARRPDIAIDEALSQDEVRDWIAAAAKYNIHVIPLVQPLGHLHYVLEKPQYAHLREMPDKVSDACPSHPETWPLVRDFLDEMIELHPDAPFIHVGLDEAHLAGSCERCKSAHPGKTKFEIFIDWFNRVCAYVSDKGKRPLAWGDMITSTLDAERIKTIHPNVVLADWSYLEDAPTQPTIARFKGSHISEQWLRRPNGPVNQLPVVNYGPGMGTIESLSDADRALIEPYLTNDDYPKLVRTLPGQRMLAGHGLRTMGASGVRVSYHGQVAPRFITGQLNTLIWALTCRETSSPGLIATSWSRGHTQAGMNAHPEQDWYGLATLSDAGWGNLTFDGLRDFDARFGIQFFGLPDGEIGDLYFQFERTLPRMQVPMASYLERIGKRIEVLRPLVQRNKDVFELFASSVKVLDMRHRAAFVLLEMEYFHAMWERVDISFRERIYRDLDGVLQDIEALRAQLVAQYAASIIYRDAAELVETQLKWSQTQLSLNRRHT